MYPQQQPVRTFCSAFTVLLLQLDSSLFNISLIKDIIFYNTCIEGKLFYRTIEQMQALILLKLLYKDTQL